MATRSLLDHAGAGVDGWVGKCLIAWRQKGWGLWINCLSSPQMLVFGSLQPGVAAANAATLSPGPAPGVCVSHHLHLL